MRLPRPILRALVRWANWYSNRRPPDNPIGGDYLLRWYVTPWRGWSQGVTVGTTGGAWWQKILSRFPNIYLHRFRRSDYDRALHDHPWASISIVLAGGYWEHVPEHPDEEHSPTRAIWRDPGVVTFRRALDRHRVELPEDVTEAVTLFITGWRVRQWGFACKEGWRSYPEWEERGGCD